MTVSQQSKFNRRSNHVALLALLKKRLLGLVGNFLCSSSFNYSDSQKTNERTARLGMRSAFPFSMMKVIQTWLTQKAMLTVLVVIAWLMQTIGSPLLAGTTGKITGTVTDANTGEPLIGATVIVVGTKLGAKTDFDGNYVILNVPPGVYEVRATYVAISQSS